LAVCIGEGGQVEGALERDSGADADAEANAETDGETDASVASDAGVPEGGAP
jgi:hypothetical protein